RRAPVLGAPPRFPAPHGHPARAGGRRDRARPAQGSLRGRRARVDARRAPRPARGAAPVPPRRRALLARARASPRTALRRATYCRSTLGATRAPQRDRNARELGPRARLTSPPDGGPRSALLGPARACYSATPP